MCTTVSAAWFAYFFICLFVYFLAVACFVGNQYFQRRGPRSRRLRALTHLAGRSKLSFAQPSLSSTLCCLSVSALFKEKLWRHSEFILEYRSLEINHRNKLNWKYCVQLYIRTHFQKKYSFIFSLLTISFFFPSFFDFHSKPQMV